MAKGKKDPVNTEARSKAAGRYVKALGDKRFYAKTNEPRIAALKELNEARQAYIDLGGNPGRKTPILEEEIIIKN